MRCKQRRDVRIACWCALFFAAAVFSPSPTAQAGPQWRVIPVEMDGVENPVVGDFALGADGTPWILLTKPRQMLAYWHQGQWHKLATDLDRTDTVRLHVAPTGQAYISGRKWNTTAGPASMVRCNGELHLLDDRQISHVTDFHLGGYSHEASLFFDSRGRIWNWGSTFVAKFEDGQWDRVEANVGNGVQVLEDAEGNVYFFGETLCYYRDGQFGVNRPMPSFSWPREAIRCCLWGKDKALFMAIGHPGLVAFDFSIMNICSVLGDETSLAREHLYDLFSDDQGNAWVLASMNGYVYHKIAVTDEHVIAQAHITAVESDDRIEFAPSPALCATDGTMYMGTQRDGVYVCSDASVSHVSWQQGLSVNATRWLYEHPDRTIWFASERMGIAAYDPHGDPEQTLTSPFQRSWEEYPLAARTALRDTQGHIWCCLENKPGKVSCWDGQAWQHLDLGPTEPSIKALWSDDLGRVHVFGRSSSRRGAGTFACRFDGDDVDCFANAEEMLVNSVETGSQQFIGTISFESFPPLITDNGEIWYKRTPGTWLARYVSGAWQRIDTGRIDRCLIKHRGHQVLVGSPDKFMVWDDGQFVEFTHESTRRQEYLLGESGLQPLDRSLYETHPAEFFPVRKTNKVLYVFDKLTDLDATGISANAVAFPENIERMWLAKGGFWLLHPNSQCALQRYWNGLALTVDLTMTPVADDLNALFCDALEDAGGDLWIRRDRTLFHVKRPKLKTRIVTSKTSTPFSPTPRIEFVGSAAAPLDGPLQYAWRVDGGPWSEPTEQTHADLKFAEAGTHTFEVLSVGSMGNLDTTPVVVTFNVEFPPPEVRIVSAPEGPVETTDVTIGYEIVKHPDGTDLTFQWRLDGEPWQDTRDTNVRLATLTNGEHFFEVRAIADGKYIQELPAAVKSNVAVPMPEVRIVSAPEEVVMDLDVVIAYEAVAGSDDADTSFQWRLDGGTWQATRDKSVRLPALRDSKHIFEVRAIRAGTFVQMPPASIEFVVRFDYRKAVLSGVKDLGASGYDQRETVVRRLVSLGRKAAPYLEGALKTADEDTRWWIQAVLAEIEDR